MKDTFQKIAIGVKLLAFLIAALAALLYASSYQKTSAFNRPNFSVSAEADVTAVPDIGEFSFSVVTEGEVLTDVQEENIEKTNTVISYLKEAGVDEKDIKTSSYQVNPRYTYARCFSGSGPCPPPTISGYSMNQSVSVKVRDLTLSGTLLGGVVENGANSVSQLSFTVDDTDIYKQEAREAAFEKAREKAEQMAEAAGFKLGRIISINEFDQSGDDYLRGYGGGALLESMSDSTIPSIEKGSEEITISVSVTYEIK